MRHMRHKAARRLLRTTQVIQTCSHSIADWRRNEQNYRRSEQKWRQDDQNWRRDEQNMRLGS